MNRNNRELYSVNLDTAQQLWNGRLSPLQLEQLKVLSERYVHRLSNE